MVKGKFGEAVNAKSEPGQVNEVLLKFLCHNLCVLVRAMHEQDIRPAFEPIVPVEPKVAWLN